MKEVYKIMPVLCLDLDGTVRRSKRGLMYFIKNEDDIELIPGMKEFILSHKDSGFLVFGISNQAGVSHNFKTVETVEKEMALTKSLIGEGVFDDIKWCYNSETGFLKPFNKRSLLRKPDIGMLALFEHECYKKGIIVDWNESFFVGDMDSDEECAKRAGITYIDAKELHKTFKNGLRLSF